MMKYSGIFIVFLVLMLWFCMPVAGVTTYLGGSPRMSAAMSGTNEFTSGQDAILRITVRNSGVESLQFVMKGSIAKMIFLQLQKELLSDCQRGMPLLLSRAIPSWQGI